jgi:hypothetical protein
MEESGFEDVVERSFYWPTSPWAKGQYYRDIAMIAQEDALSSLEALSLKVIGSIGWSAEEIRNFLIDVRRDIKDISIHCFIPM